MLRNREPHLSLVPRYSAALAPEVEIDEGAHWYLRSESWWSGTRSSSSAWGAGGAAVEAWLTCAAVAEVGDFSRPQTDHHLSLPNTMLPSIRPENEVDRLEDVTDATA